VDGADADDTGNASRVAPTTGTLDSAASSDFSVGATSGGGNKADFEIGAVGYRDAYLTNYADFSNAADASLPAVIDEKGWWQWDGRSAGDFGMTTFDGSTGYYKGTDITLSGNDVTVCVRFNIASFTGGTAQMITSCEGSVGAANYLWFIQAYSSDHASSDFQDKIIILIRNTATTIICRLVTPTGYLDGSDHVLFAAFDGDAGTAVFRIDGTDVDDTGNASRTAPTTGTLDSGTNDISVGATFGGANFVNGTIGFFGCDDSYLTNYADFMTGSTPLDIDELHWTEWGAQPLYWNRTGEMADNKGSAANMTVNGTIKPPRPLFWCHSGDMTLNKGSGGAMTENGTPTYTVGGSP
jgi:hypothetical protein